MKTTKHLLTTSKHHCKKRFYLVFIIVESNNKRKIQKIKWNKIWLIAQHYMQHIIIYNIKKKRYLFWDLQKMTFTVKNAIQLLLLRKLNFRWTIDEGKQRQRQSKCKKIEVNQHAQLNIQYRTIKTVLTWLFSMPWWNMLIRLHRSEGDIWMHEISSRKIHANVQHTSPWEIINIRIGLKMSYSTHQYS